MYFSHLIYKFNFIRNHTVILNEKKPGTKDCTIMARLWHHMINIGEW